MDLIDRLYARLRDAVDRQPGGAGAAALTVADVYQRLVPYRAVRGELAILELAEYEHALVRLLSGERGYVEMDGEAQAELQREIASPNPILGVYRDYAGAPLRLVAGLSSSADRPPSRGPDVTEEAPPPLAPRGDAPVRVDLPAVADETSPLPHATASRPLPQRGGVTPFDACRRCGEPLPDEADLRFCPACGADQRETPCARCGSQLKAEWNFCVRCGNPRGVAPPGI